MRQWGVWFAAAVVVAAAFAFISPLGDGPAPVAWAFVLILLCFMTGSLANSMFLSRPLRRGGQMVFPAVREPEAIERAPERSEVSRPQPRAMTSRPRPRAVRSGGEEPSFASSSEIGSSIGVTVLISSEVGAEPVGAHRVDLNELQVIESIPAQKTRDEVVEVVSGTGARGPESGPYPGAVRAKSDGRSPHSAYRVKGNTRSKRYHTMQSPYYERTKAGVWFRSAADAERAGFAAWNARVNDAV
ncbi:hypothetical protein EIL87_11270 [Saccharopolyspora rhizosphaerae]|uniref:Uncharacterized protein n=1 Tax=Saccharopolyspora rhizosphaerae TaxID=2492662 RepID=A0A3R8R2R1_9PSEU|nr:hypothetical protein EIL87_11270 [Saccharopolyspora rhizosphaerae]